MKLKIFTNFIDTVVAHSPEDAVNVWNECAGDDYIGYGDVDDWIEENKQILTIWYHDNPIDREEAPCDAIVSDENGTLYITATSEQWIKSNGRGWLCSTEY